MKKNCSLFTYFLTMILTITSTSVPCKSMEQESSGLIFFHATHAIQGSRDHMEDRCFPDQETSALVADKTAFFGVYDGHGGSTSAELASQELHRNIVENPLFFQGEIEQAIIEGYAQLDTACCAKEDGTTAVTALIQGSTLWIANVGDSEAVGFDGESTFCFSQKHKPTDPEEMQRILQHDAGCITLFDHAPVQNEFGIEEIKTVKTTMTRGNLDQKICGNASMLSQGSFLQSYNPYNGNFVVENRCPQRVFIESEFGGLAMSRSIGDAAFKPINKATPFIQSFKIEKPVFFIMASDGLWDTMSYEAAAGIVVQHFLQNGLDFANCFTPEKIQHAQEIASAAAQRLVGAAQELEPHMDNTTVSIIFLAPA